MIYLRYVYQKSGIPEASSVGLQIDDIEPVQADVLDEFSTAFPRAKVQQSNSSDTVFDLYVFAFRKRVSPLELTKWGLQHRYRARLGLGFFCISERTLTVVPRGHFYLWALRDMVSSALIGIAMMYLKVQKHVQAKR